VRNSPISFLKRLVVRNTILLVVLLVIAAIAFGWFYPDIVNSVLGGHK
jgi:hypothetical protein